MEAALSLSNALPEEERQEVDHERSYQRLLARLSHQSVVKHYDAYADVPWDDPAFAIDPTDARFELDEDDPLGATAWYRGQPATTRARLGLHTLASFARIGWTFESVLKRGLLEFAATLPDDAPEFRYAYHEVIEEAQHSLIFHEFVRRTGLDVRPPKVLGRGQHRIVQLGRRFPALFFILVLSGEDPIDWVQRRQLQSGRPLHPLVERISRIHITEEARHMAFARHYLLRTVPNLGALDMLRLRLQTPQILKVAAALMMQPTAHIIATYNIPKGVLEDAYGPGSSYRALVVEALRKPRELCWQLGILNDRWSRYWKRLGIWAPAPGR